MWPVHISHFLLLLHGPSLVYATICQDQGYFTDAERQALITAHNELRRTIAEGNQPNQQGTLPQAKNMYELQYNCDMENIVKEEVGKCSGHATLLEQYGQNFLVLPTANMPAGKTDRLNAAVGVWKGPQTYYGLNNISNYDDHRLYSFANMVNAKTLRFGCGYKADCNGGDIHISCIYNLE
ncbi:SCP-like protein [Ancylostoma caninum]|uniref:SCP-like protein n=1 Tax=Ancylostoma caninum TaxID=29170 RepID=A0A368FZJ3_ANCCA|nr:SCP-like protein [Ancylostoma caninum]